MVSSPCLTKTRYKYNLDGSFSVFLPHVSSRVSKQGRILGDIKIFRCFRHNGLQSINIFNNLPSSIFPSPQKPRFAS